MVEGTAAKQRTDDIDSEKKNNLEERRSGRLHLIGRGRLYISLGGPNFRCLAGPNGYRRTRGSEPLVYIHVFTPRMPSSHGTLLAYDGISLYTV